MEPIPLWVRRPWDAWDLRILVLMSFGLQVVLAIFGSRRKYMSSSWISVLVWSAYLMADWVATVALGKLSDSENSQGNNKELWAIWAPLLLLHLGGPDNITAYSLEDNQLWMRHLLGLAVQIFVVIYVILSSWKNSWFLFMSLPAFIAGVTKYGERTLVLKSVSSNKYIDNIPVDDLGDDYSTEGNEYVNVLVRAHKHLRDFTIRLEDTFHSLADLRYFPFPDNIATETMWDAVDVEMGLMYDLSYTKATKIYRKGGWILRFISFGSTMIVLVGLIYQTAQFNFRKEDDKIDIAITWVLIVGALILEVYAAIVIVSSHWMMLWLIKKGRQEWVIKLSDRFPWLFKKKKNWSNTMGQFDLLDYWLKQRENDIHSPSRKRSIRLGLWRAIGSVIGHKYEEQWKRSRHRTQVSVRSSVHKAISNLCKPESGYSKCYFFDSGHDQELHDIGNIFAHERRVQTVITYMHLATKICYHLETETDDDHGPDSSLWKEDREVSKALSDYMMYLLMLQPSMLQDSGSTTLEESINDPKELIGDTQEVGEACRHLLTKEGTSWCKVMGVLNGINGKPRRWEVVKLQWWRILQCAFNSGFRLRDGNLQQLTQGGEFLTFLLIYYTPPVVLNSDIPPVVLNSNTPPVELDVATTSEETVVLISNTPPVESDMAPTSEEETVSEP